MQESKSIQVKLKLWKKIGKLQSFNDHDKCLQPIQSPMSASNINEYLNVNKKSKISHNSSISDHAISDQQSQSIQTNSSYIESSKSIFDEIKQQGIDIQNIDDSQSFIEEEQVIEESEFQKYQSRFKINFLQKQQVSAQSGKSIVSQNISEQFSPLPPFIDPSLAYWSSRHHFKIVLKLRETQDKLESAKSELKFMRQTLKKFQIDISKFIKNQQTELQIKLLRKESTKNQNLVLQNCLKVKQNSMIIEEDQSHHSFSVKKSRVNSEAVDQSCQIGQERNLTPIKKQSIIEGIQFEDNYRKSPNFNTINVNESFCQKDYQQMSEKQKIHFLKQKLNQKDTQIQELKHLMTIQKEQYLEYKKLFGQTNNQLNTELDQMIQRLKLQQEKYSMLEGQFIKLKELIQMKSSISRQNVMNSLARQSKISNAKDSQVKSDDGKSHIQKQNSKIKDLEGQNLRFNKEITDLQAQNQRLSMLLDQKNVQLELRTMELAAKTQQLLSKSEQLNSFRQQCEDHLSQLPQFRQLNTVNEQQQNQHQTQSQMVNRVYSFGMEGQMNGSLMMGSALQQNKFKHLFASHPQSSSNYHSSHFDQPLKTNMNRQQILRIKEQKLKQYEMQIQEFVERQKFQRDEIYKQKSQIERLKKTQQKARSLKEQLEQTKKSIQEISIVRKQVEESNQKLYEHIFDLEQRVTKSQNQYTLYMQQVNELLKKEKVKSEQTQLLYKELLQKIQTINIQNSIIPVTQFHSFPSAQSIVSQTNNGVNSTEDQVKLYKKLYEEKKIELQQMKKIDQERRQNFILNEQLEKQTDKFRIQSLKQDLLAKDETIKNLHQQKQQLSNKVKELSGQLLDKQYSIEKLTLEIKKLKLDENSHNQRESILSLSNKAPVQRQKLYESARNEQRLKQNYQYEQYLKRKQEELHRAQLKLQTQNRKLQLTKKQIQSEYQSLLMKYNDIKTSQQENMNRKSLQHLLNHSVSSRKKRAYQNEASIYPPSTNRNERDLVNNSMRYLNTSRFKSPQQNSIQAQKILNDLKSRQHFPTSDRQTYMNLNKDMLVRMNRSPSVKRITTCHHSSTVNQVLNKIRSNSPRSHRVEQKVSPLRRVELIRRFSPKEHKRPTQVNKSSQEKKIKMRIIEQKMKKLKEQMRDSMKYPNH